jgi:hypothetical protein
LIDIKKFGSLRKLLRVTAYVSRFTANCKSEKSARRLEHLTVEEISKAEQMWINSCQNCAYTSEIQNLRSKESRLPLVKQLRLFLDNTGAIRCGGRIHNAPLAEVTKFPYLLPQNHHFTKLVLLDAHERLLHSGPSSTVTYIRQKFWVPAIRQRVRNMLRKCIVCRKVSGKPYAAPDPPPLPEVRVQDSQPFAVTGVDFSGCLYVRGKHGEESKAYICLFTCATTRAVHLELVTDLSVESFMQAFRRFCSRKSVPRIMVSDNATTYLSAAKQIHSLYSSRAVHEELETKGTEWRFIPKRAPWYGGWWERLIGLTKTAVRKVLGRSYVTFQSLATVVTEIEALLNDRPLTYVTSGELELEPLTPSHLLYGRRITKLPYTDTIDLSTINSDTSNHGNITKWASIQKTLIHDFRERWKH